MHHLETSPVETFRVVEAEEEVEELQDIVEEPQATVEEPPIPRIGEREERTMIRTTRNGMIPKQPAQVRAKSHRKNIVNIVTIVTTVTPRKGLRKGNPQGTILRTSRKRREQEVPALERKDIVGGKEA